MTADVLCWPPGYVPHCLDGETVQVRAGAWRGESYTLTGGELLQRVTRLIDNRSTADQILDQ
ncbi:MAG: hypothetical protein JWN15_680, partial [Firmicutes bacterium]|nr:hypothetical protein [Bacillota bacterium]